MLAEALGLAGVVVLPCLAGAQDPSAADPHSAPSPSPGAAPASSPVSVTYDGDAWADRPQGQWPWSLLETIDGSMLTDRIGNGGLYVGEAPLLGVHGSSWTQVSFRLGELDVTDPDRIGTPMFLPEAIAFSSANVATALMPVGVAGPGAAVQFLPRAGGDEWHGAISGDFVPIGLQSSVPLGPPAIARYASFGRGRFRLGGPLAHGKMRLFLAGAITRAGRLERDDAGQLPARDANALANVSWRATSTDDVTLMVGVQGVTHAYSGRARLAGSGASERDSFLMAQSSWQHRGPLPLVVSAGYVRGAFDPQASADPAGRVVERLRDGPVPQLFAGASRRERGSFGARLTPSKGGLGGDHSLEVGLGASWTRSATRPAPVAGLTAERVGGEPARVWDYGWPRREAVWRGSDVFAYAADSAHWGRATMDLGLRLQSASASAEGGAAHIRWTTVSLRLAARVRLTRGDSLAARAGYARYHDRPSLSLAGYGDPNALQGSVYRWLDTNGDGAFEPDERGPLVARVGPGGGVGSVDAGLRAPSTDEVVAGLEARVGGSWSVHVLGIRRHEHDLLAVVNEGAPRAAYTIFSVPDVGGDVIGKGDDQLLPIYDRIPATFGQDRYRLVNSSDEVLHEGVEIGASGSIGAHLVMGLGAMGWRSIGPAGDVGFLVSENDQGILDNGMGSPNAATLARGRLFFDRSYTLKISAAYRAPGDLRVGATARYQDGQPFARLYVAPDLNQGAEAIRAIPNGRSRFTYTLTIDARVEKEFRVGRARLAAVLEVFNVPGDAKEVEEDVVTGSSFRAVSAVQPPRAFRLGARLEF